MEIRPITFHSLESAAAELGLPQKYLRDLARENKIPYLTVGGRMRLNPAAVADALDRLSQQAVSHAEN
jgi:excisionase family DNA binding protein